LAEWGGELEIKALSSCLKKEIHVFSAEAPLLKMGEENRILGSSPLLISFHNHFYSLGAHYNSIVPIDYL
jgi:OTU domain-containing protein 6